MIERISSAEPRVSAPYLLPRRKGSNKAILGAFGHFVLRADSSQYNTYISWSSFVSHYISRYFSRPPCVLSRSKKKVYAFGRDDVHFVKGDEARPRGSQYNRSSSYNKELSCCLFSDGDGKKINYKKETYTPHAVCFLVGNPTS